jgi:hypothetical protein
MSRIHGQLDPEARATLDPVLAKWAAPGMCNPDDEAPCVDGEPREEAVHSDTRSQGAAQPRRAEHQCGIRSPAPAGISANNIREDVTLQSGNAVSVWAFDTAASPGTAPRQKNGTVMTTPEPDEAPSTAYPSAWRPRGAPIPDDELDPPDVEAYLGSLTPAQLQALLARARGGDR